MLGDAMGVPSARGVCFSGDRKDDSLDGESANAAPSAVNSESSPSLGIHTSLPLPLPSASGLSPSATGVPSCWCSSCARMRGERRGVERLDTGVRTAGAGIEPPVAAPCSAAHAALDVGTAIFVGVTGDGWLEAFLGRFLRAARCRQTRRRKRGHGQTR